MKAYKLEVLVVDFDGVGPDGARVCIEEARYPNRCISPNVMVVETRDIGEWSDDHPLNRRSTAGAYYKQLFRSDA